MIRYTVNELTTLSWSFEEDVRYYKKVGVPAITPQKRKLEPHGIDKGIELLKDTGLDENRAAARRKYGIAFRPL